MHKNGRAIPYTIYKGFIFTTYVCVRIRMYVYHILISPNIIPGLILVPKHF